MRGEVWRLVADALGYKTVIGNIARSRAQACVMKTGGGEVAGLGGARRRAMMIQMSPRGGKGLEV